MTNQVHDCDDWFSVVFHEEEHSKGDAMEDGPSAFAETDFLADLETAPSQATREQRAQIQRGEGG